VLVWMDLEMTGLDPGRNVIVEIATLVTDNDLELIDDGLDLVVHQPTEALALMEDVVRGMHTSSGLLKEIEASTVSLEDAGARTLEYIKSHVSEPRSVPLCGNSIGTDRRFLAAYLNDIEEYLHYRSIDVSSIKELAGAPAKAGSHRALGDIRESVAELKYYRDAVFKPTD
jgi:oligoribonuclease